MVLGGQYTFTILELHKQYGPIIRMNPMEVHVADNDFFHGRYMGPSQRRDEAGLYAHQFGADDSIFGTVDRNLHKVQRAALNPFFSTSEVHKLQGVVEEQVDNLLDRLYALAETYVPGWDEFSTSKKNRA
ncbi:hypothetical protein SLS53_008301 [Cytospora paraplurivora]|uniref:Cytochrome P450 n=1 Tax=Cytospora paraplurivora TaxID=2898453 RepID=A0AAN9YD61_9PEZI